MLRGRAPGAAPPLPRRPLGLGRPRTRPMKEASYTAIVAMADAAIASNAPLDPEAVAAAGADYEAAISIRRQLHTRWIRRHAPEVREQLPALAAEWRAGADITTLARRCAYPPYLTARLLIEVLCGVPKAKVGDVVKAADTAIEDPRLRRELREAMDADPDTGPANDRVRRIVGAEYELLLQRKLRGRRVPYESEDELRVRGLAKTPDVRFLIPLGVRDPRSGAWCGESRAFPSSTAKWPNLTYTHTTVLVDTTQTYQTHQTHQTYRTPPQPRGELDRLEGHVRRSVDLRVRAPAPAHGLRQPLRTRVGDILVRLRRGRPWRCPSPNLLTRLLYHHHHHHHPNQPPPAMALPP